MGFIFFSASRSAGRDSEVLEKLGEIRTNAFGDAHTWLRGVHEKEAVPLDAPIPQEDQTTRRGPKQAQDQVPLLPLQVPHRM